MRVMKKMLLNMHTLTMSTMNKGVDPERQGDEDQQASSSQVQLR